MGLSDADISYLRRAMRLACNARGYAEPNPTVGCVIVKDGRAIGEGWTQAFGGPHAEPTALAACTAESPEGATAYVTLEPCSHTNKKTPPCAPRLITAKLARVVVGCLDPNPPVNGNGVATLRAAGIAVDLAPAELEAECKQVIAPFIAFTVLKRPYVTLKWAQTADGKVAGPGGRRMQISNAASSRLVHELRARSDAILVGVNTVLVDDPLLTARVDAPLRTPIRCVVDTTFRTPIESQLVRSVGAGPVVIITSAESLRHAPERVAAFRAAGVEVIGVVTGETEPGAGDDRPVPEDVLCILARRGVTHLLVEPGPTLARAYFRVTDRVWIFSSDRRVDDATAPAAATVPGHFIPTKRIDAQGDQLSEYLNTRSPVFFDSTWPSADFQLAREA
ncbi:MAG TPA: bifunctional diaminohydroxyphosphoribosylaminopyrimidine deaminase/5-amino-6-(5-phosphoribosylamino)uracil reductase RibD [Tepidisphaeraceae bacterium]|nr:bifunctional diaminohydroxyphosphoribosylaminopyrimidine deaminase/5-amino-6-(5-phosphoribosylamino)uracil reductase RibD [Tepidisphaeraceae bacterium]